MFSLQKRSLKEDPITVYKYRKSCHKEQRNNLFFMPLERGQEENCSNYSYRNSGWISEKPLYLQESLGVGTDCLGWLWNLCHRASKEELDKCLLRWQRQSWILEAEHRLHNLHKPLPTLFSMVFFFTLLTYIRKFFIFIETSPINLKCIFIHRFS